MELEIGAMPTLEGRFISSKLYPILKLLLTWPSPAFFWRILATKKWEAHIAVVGSFPTNPSPVAPGVPGAREAWESNLEHNTICGALLLGEQLGALGPHEKPTHKDIMYCSCKLNTWQFRIQVC